MKINNKTKDNSEVEAQIHAEDLFKDKFLNLSFRVHNLSEDNPGIISRLLFDLVEKEKKYMKDYEPNEYDYIETVGLIELLLDDIETCSNSTKH